MGKKNAAVFPDAVWAQTTKCLFSLIAGVTYFHTGTGWDEWVN